MTAVNTTGASQPGYGLYGQNSRTVAVHSPLLLAQHMGFSGYGAGIQVYQERVTLWEYIFMIRCINIKERIGKNKRLLCNLKLFKRCKAVIKNTTNSIRRIIHIYIYKYINIYIYIYIYFMYSFYSFS